MTKLWLVSSGRDQNRATAATAPWRNLGEFLRRRYRTFFLVRFDDTGHLGTHRLAQFGI